MSLKPLIDQLRDFDTALLANTMWYTEPTPPHEIYLSGQIQSVTPTLGPSCGVAVTCEMDSSTPNNPSVMDPFWQQLDAMQALGLPVIWVVKTIGSRPDHECVMGDGMAKLLKSVGCDGVVTDGGVRDISGLLATPLPVYCRGTVIHHVHLRIPRVDIPVEVGGITIHPGDIIHANSEGVIKIPRRAVEKLSADAVKMRAVEHAVHVIWRRSDISNADKRKHATKVFEEYGFGKKAGVQHELK